MKEVRFKKHPGMQQRGEVAIVTRGELEELLPPCGLCSEQQNTEDTNRKRIQVNTVPCFFKKAHDNLDIG